MLSKATKISTKQGYDDKSTITTPASEALLPCNAYHALLLIEFKIEKLDLLRTSKPVLATRANFNATNYYSTVCGASLIYLTALVYFLSR